MKIKYFFTEAILTTKTFNSQVFVIVFRGTLNVCAAKFFLGMLSAFVKNGVFETHHAKTILHTKFRFSHKVYLIVFCHYSVTF